VQQSAHLLASETIVIPALIFLLPLWEKVARCVSIVPDEGSFPLTLTLSRSGEREQNPQPREHVMRGLDPRICHNEEMTGSSPVMTKGRSGFRRPGMKEGWSGSRGAREGFRV
jgi:hypothetical protein